jgi:thiazole tautomerase (transcriptional regulator TenI)
MTVGVPVLHAVTSDEWVASPNFVAHARAVMQAGGARVAVHLRASAMPTRSLFILAELLAEAQRTTRAWVVVNDRLDVAMASGVRGIQVPSRGFELADVRRVAASERLAIGHSVHDAGGAARAASAGADWCVAGHVYETPSHAARPGRGEQFVREVVAAAGPLPVVAIGGVTPGTVATLRRAGAHGVAAIRGIWGNPDPAVAVAEYLSAYDHSGFSDLAGAHGQW